MFNNKRMNPNMGVNPNMGANPYGQFSDAFTNPYQNPSMSNPNMSSMYPNFQFDRVQYEIKENRRRINNLAKRIVRIENYLRIRDNSEYSVDEDNQPNDFTL